MMGFLINLKRKWERCKDPEKEIVQKMWRLALGRLYVLQSATNTKVLSNKDWIYSIVL